MVAMRVGRSDFRFPTRVRTFSFIQKSLDRLWGPLTLLLVVYQISFVGIQRLGPDVYWPPFRAETENEWSYVYTPPIRLNAVDRMKKKPFVTMHEGCCTVPEVENSYT